MPEDEKEVLLTETLSDIKKQLEDLKIRKEDLQKKLGDIKKKIDFVKEEEHLVEEHTKILIREEANLNELLDEEVKLAQEKERMEKELFEIRNQVSKAEELSKKITKG